MSPHDGSVPSASELEAYGLGKMDLDRAAEIESFLARNPSWAEALAAIPDDALMQQLRGAGELPTAAGESGPRPPAADGDKPDLDTAAVFAAHPRYVLLRKLGEGGMGIVFLAEHRILHRQVALKIIRPHHLANPVAVERFRREVKAAGQLSHPNIVTAHDAETAGSIHFLVMEYVEGVPLSEWLAGQGPLTAGEACSYVRQVAQGLQFAHEKGFVHRDLKPHNLMRQPDGTVKILDFGLARLACEEEKLDSEPVTGLGIVMGTADYMAPEQAQDSHSADIRADVYSLGCTLYQLLSGQPPFPGGKSLDKLIRHARERPESLARLRPDLPPELVAVVEKMMAREVENRYQSPAEVAAALEPFTQLAPLSTPVRPPRCLMTVGVGGLFLLAAIILGLVLIRIQTDRGVLEITSEDDEVAVIVKKGGQVIRIVDTRTEKEIVLHSGTYELEMKGARGLKLDLERATLTRGGRVLARIVRVPTPKIEPKPDQKPPAPLLAPRELEVVRTFPCGRAHAPAFSEDGRYCVGFGGETFRVWETATGKRVQEVTGLPGTVSARFLSGGTQLLTSHLDGTFRRWDLATGHLLNKLHASPEWRVIGGISPDARRFSFTGDRAIHVWELETGRECLVVRASEPQAVQLDSHGLSPDGKRLLVADLLRPNRGALVRIFDTQTGKQVRSIRSSLWPDNLAWSGDSRHFYLNGGHAGTHYLVTWDANTGKEISRVALVPGLSSTHGRFFSRTGRFFVAVYHDKQLVHVYDARSGRLVGTASGAVGGFCVVFTPDERFLACGHPGAIVLYRLPSQTKPSAAGPEDGAKKR